MSSLVGRFLFKTPPCVLEETEESDDPSTNGVGGFLKRRRKGDLGEEVMRETVSCGEESVETLFLQKRDDTGELQTAKEHDMVLFQTLF